MRESPKHTISISGQNKNKWLWNRIQKLASFFESCIHTLSTVHNPKLSIPKNETSNVSTILFSRSLDSHLAVLQTSFWTAPVPQIVRRTDCAQKRAAAQATANREPIYRQKKSKGKGFHFFIKQKLLLQNYQRKEMSTKHLHDKKH